MFTYHLLIFGGKENGRNGTEVLGKLFLAILMLLEYLTLGTNLPTQIEKVKFTQQNIFEVSMVI